MSKARGPDDWERAHHADALAFLRAQLSPIVSLHLSVAGCPGHLTVREIQFELLQAAAIAGMPEAMTAVRAQGGGA